MKTKNPCPFCNELSVQIIQSESPVRPLDENNCWQAECGNCGARGPQGYADKRSAALAWEYGDAPGSLTERIRSHPCPDKKIEDLIFSIDGLIEKNTAVAMLRKILIDGGNVLSGEAVEAMRRNGYTAKQTRMAREALRLIITRKGFGLETRTYWMLPAREMTHLRKSHWSL